MLPGYELTVPAASRPAGTDDYNPAPEQLDDPESKFELLQLLGRGSYGCVYKARVVETGEIVAVKVIPLTEQDEMESIQKEIAMLRDCSHPNVVKYLGSWRAPDALWIAMEYCAGGSVSDIMNACDAPLEEAVISYVCGETLAGLAYLHALGRVHRDIKCGNILLTDSGEVKLADFGVAAQLTSTLSKRNTFIGTPHWMAPEVITASHYDGKVDVWALGISAVEMAERYPPRWRVNPNRVIFMVVRDPPPRLADKERWSLAFQDFVAQCLNKDARSRPTARYLQQHKFIARDRASGIRALLPAVHRARAQYAAAAEPMPAAPSASEDGFFSWRQQAGATVLGPERFASAASGTVVQHPPGAAAWSGGDGGLAPGAEASGTVVVMRGPTESSSAAEIAAVGGGGGALLARELSAAASAQAEASMDYLAAVNAVSAAAADLDLLSPRPPSSWSPARAPPLHPRGQKTEAQRLVERLHVLHSSGEVVPLPFLRATDAAPLALVGAEGGGLQAGGGWQGALAEVLAEASANGEGDAAASGTRALPPALAQRVLGSPVLLNLAVALSRHKGALEEQRREGVPAWAQEALRGKAEALSDTLRTILCL